MQKSNKIVLYIICITLISRTLSLTSYQIYMSFYGAQNQYLNIYSYALNIPNIIFNCLGTSLNTVIIPIYSSLITKKENIKANKFLNDIINISFIFIIFLILIFWILSPYFVNMTSYKHMHYNSQFMIFSIRVLLFLMFFYDITYIFQGIHQSNGSFIIPALVSLPSSLISIIYVIFWGDRYGIKGLLFITILGMFFQVIILIPKVIKIGYRYKFSINFKNEDMIIAYKLILPILVSVSSYQINMFFNNTLAVFFNIVTVMIYIQNLILVSTLSIIYSITSVYFIKLSKLWSLNNKEEFKKIVKEIIIFILFLFMPIASMFIILRFNIINLLSKWGNFSEESFKIASNMFGIYSLSIVFLGIKEVLDKSFYAKKDTKTPAISGFIIMISNILISLSLLKLLGVYSISLSYSVSIFIGALFMVFSLNKKLQFIDKKFFIIIIKFTICTFIMSIIIYLENKFIEAKYFINEIITRILKLFIPGISGIFIYFIFSYILKVPQVYILFNKFIKDKKKD